MEKCQKYRNASSNFTQNNNNKTNYKNDKWETLGKKSNLKSQKLLETN